MCSIKKHGWTGQCWLKSETNNSSRYIALNWGSWFIYRSTKASQMTNAETIYIKMVIPRRDWPRYALLSLTCARKMGNLIPFICLRAVMTTTKNEKKPRWNFTFTNDIPFFQSVYYSKHHISALSLSSNSVVAGVFLYFFWK